MNTICKMRDIYKALSIFETAFEEVYGISLNEAMAAMCVARSRKGNILDCYSRTNGNGSVAYVESHPCGRR